MKRAFEGEAWHGPSLTETLKGVTAEQAAARPVAGAHSIWEIVLHVSAWQKAVRTRVGGEKVEAPDQGDWPTARATSPSDWEKTLTELEHGYKELRETIARLSDFDLEKNPPGSENSIYIQLHGTIQHNLYHAGQIAVLKKAITK